MQHIVIVFNPSHYPFLFPTLLLRTTSFSPWPPGAMPAFYVGTGDSNSDPHACITCHLIHRATSSALFFMLSLLSAVSTALRNFLSCPTT